MSGRSWKARARAKQAALEAAQAPPQPTEPSFPITFSGGPPLVLLRPRQCYVGGPRKECLETEEAARRALADAADAQRRRGEEKVVSRYYWHRECRSFHLTSQPYSVPRSDTP